MFSKKTNNKIMPIGIPPLSPSNEMIGSNLTTPTSPGLQPRDPKIHIQDSPAINLVTETTLGLFNNIPGVAIHQEKEDGWNIGKSIRTSLVYFYNNNEEKDKHPKFKCKMRNVSCWKFMCSHCQSFDIEIFSIKENLTEVPLLRIVRPCSFSFCGMFRSRVEVYLIEGEKSELLGYFLEPSYCFDIVLAIYTKSSRQADFLVDGNCLQRNLWCPGGYTNKATFSVTTHKFEVLSKIIKTLKITNDKYTADEANAMIAFPLDSSETENALLTCAAVLLDFKYFDS
jgi:hypothetical protein